MRQSCHIGRRQRFYLLYVSSDVSSGNLTNRNTCHTVNRQRADVHNGFSFTSLDDYIGRKSCYTGSKQRAYLLYAYSGALYWFAGGLLKSPEREDMLHSEFD